MQMHKENRTALASGHPLPKCFAEKLLVIRRGRGVWLEDRAGRGTSILPPASP